MSTRILALDHGTVRIGVAISDDMLMIAQPEPYVPAEPPEAIETYIHEQWEGQLKLILVGMPRNMDGSYMDLQLKKSEPSCKDSRKKWMCPSGHGMRD